MSSEELFHETLTNPAPSVRKNRAARFCPAAPQAATTHDAGLSLACFHHSPFVDAACRPRPRLIYNSLLCIPGLAGRDILRSLVQAHAGFARRSRNLAPAGRSVRHSACPCPATTAAPTATATPRGPAVAVLALYCRLVLRARLKNCRARLGFPSAVRRMDFSNSGEPRTGNPRPSPLRSLPFPSASHMGDAGETPTTTIGSLIPLRGTHSPQNGLAQAVRRQGRARTTLSLALLTSHNRPFLLVAFRAVWTTARRLLRARARRLGQAKSSKSAGADCPVRPERPRAR